ncbi:hypothetical protein FRC02_011498 [Tulasnella sp. 418]|nr:hypothetical protein FRC02_011498 [Tulasnella sp. 418]
MRSSIIFILRILGFTAIISPVIAGAGWSRPSPGHLSGDLDPCPPDKDFFLGNGREHRWGFFRGVGVSYTVQNEGPVRYRASLIAAGKDECLYRLDQNDANYAKTRQKPVTRTVLTYRGDRMYTADGNKTGWTFLRDGETKDEHFKYVISPEEDPWPYGDEIDHRLEDTANWEEWLKPPVLYTPPQIYLDKPTEEQFFECLEKMKELYRLMIWVLPELAFRVKQSPSEQLDFFNQITFTRFWRLIRIDDSVKGTGSVPKLGLFKLMRDSKYPIFDNAKYGGVCFSRRRNPDYELPRRIAGVERLVLNRMTRDTVNAE